MRDMDEGEQMEEESDEFGKDMEALRAATKAIQSN